MNRRNLIRVIASSIPIYIGLPTRAFSRVINAKDETRKSPHAEALALVMENQREEIAKAELKHFKEKGTDWFKGGAEQYWWHDTIERSWSATRPFAPGLIDSTHYFIVTYSIDKDEIARWVVDTHKRTAQMVAKDFVL